MSKARKLGEPTNGYMMDSLDEVEGFKTTGHAAGHSHALSTAQRRKLGQKPRMARELPKKSGYLLKKGPLKVRQRFDPALGRMPLCGGLRGVAKPADRTTTFSLRRCGRSAGLCWRTASCRTSARTSR